MPRTAARRPAHGPAESPGMWLAGPQPSGRLAAPHRSHPMRLPLSFRTASRLLPAIIGVLALSAPARAQCSLAFGPPTSYGIGGSPVWVAVGDLNGDGRPDLVVANSTTPFVSVLRGN